MAIKAIFNRNRLKGRKTDRRNNENAFSAVKPDAVHRDILETQDSMQYITSNNSAFKHHPLINHISENL